MSAQLLTGTVILAYMGRRRDKHHPLVQSDQLLAAFSEQDDQIFEGFDIVSASLTQADVDARGRRIIWNDGQRLSITQSARRIHATHPDFPLQLIEDSVIGWLEMEFAPETYSEEQLDELDRLTEKWVENHRAAREKRRRTPDS
jgi:hypothetical protein